MLCQPGLHREILESFEPLHSGGGVALHSEGDEAVLPLAHRVLVGRVDELRLGAALRDERSTRGVLPVLGLTSKYFPDFSNISYQFRPLFSISRSCLLVSGRS